MTSSKQSEAMKRANVQRLLKNSHELIVKQILDEKKINYKWQKVFFLWKNGDKYRIVDFYLPAPVKMIVEIDGSFHDSMKDYDSWKDRRIISKITGCKVMRYTNQQVSHPDFKQSFISEIMTHV